MSDTLVVLGLDAADYDLVRRWDCRNMLLSNHDTIETFSHSLDVPATYEVWPTIASGTLPEEHGVTVPSSWDERGIVLRSLTYIGSQLPEVFKPLAVELKHTLEGRKSKTQIANMFDRGEVYNWPGLTPSSDWEQEGEWFVKVRDGEMTEERFRQLHLANAGKGIGWLAGMHQSGVPIAGAHIHILDHIGHLYAKRPEKLRPIYEGVDELVGWLRERVDQLVIVSDHGMQTSVTEDSQPGVHSFRSMISSTEAGELPKEMTEIREWVESRVAHREPETVTEMDAPVEHLNDLGYL